MNGYEAKALAVRITREAPGLTATVFPIAQGLAVVDTTDRITRIKTRYRNEREWEQQTGRRLEVLA